MPDIFDPTPDPPPTDITPQVRVARPAPAAPATPAPAQPTQASPVTREGSPEAKPDSDSRTIPAKPSGTAQIDFADSTPRIRFPTPHFSNVGRPHPRPLTQSKFRNESVTHLNTSGLIGDLTDYGIEYLAGYIARSNGIPFAGMPCHKFKNPGGFGLTLINIPREVSPLLIYPEPGDPSFCDWMKPLRAYYQNGGRIELPVPDFSFPSWRDGADALRTYIRAIQASSVPLFPEGPGTAIVTFLSAYTHPCATKSNEVFSLHAIIAELEALDSFSSTLSGAPGDNTNA